ncbi:MAG: hypothetical protein HUU54_04320 [Ignavibacteriaceae bacterium]|nr:hypothetical protein [Ignavibacteriaceae bacterium]
MSTLTLTSLFSNLAGFLDPRRIMFLFRPYCILFGNTSTMSGSIKDFQFTTEVRSSTETGVVILYRLIKTQKHKAFLLAE